MKALTPVIERDTETGVLVGHIPGFRGAHSQAVTMDELEASLTEVIAMLREDTASQASKQSCLAVKRCTSGKGHD